MKKAKRLLAILLAALMLFSAASISSYAYVSEEESWRTPRSTGGQKYYYTYEQAASWVLDMLDNLLAGAGIALTCEELNELAGVEVLGQRVNIFTSNAMINLDDKLEAVGGFDENGEPTLDLRSIDGAIKSLTAVFNALTSGVVDTIEKFGVLGDLIGGEVGLQSTGLDVGILRTTESDRKVLEMLILWLGNQREFLRTVLAGQMNLGSILGGLVGDLIGDLLPVDVPITDNKINGPALVKNLLYNLLIDNEARTAGSGDMDQWVQQVIDWALITGTGDGSDTDPVKTDATFGDGSKSLLGANADPLMPVLGDQPGGATIGEATITVDRDKDGTTETANMSFYQLVNNIIQALMGGMLYDMVYDLLADALGIEITEEFPKGDPAVLQDEMFSIILGAVEGLLVGNGAPEITYTSDESTYPVPKLKKLLNWLLVGDKEKGTNPALDTFLLITYNGLTIQDNFMSLLNDVARLLINLLPSLGLFASSEHLAYTPEDLTISWYIDDNFNLVQSTDDSKVTQTYVTYETNEVIYPTEFVTDANGAQQPSAYCYLDDKSPVILKDANGNGDVNAKLIRPNYVITTKMVFANIIKLALNDFVDGCYFPEWTTDIPSVLAYGLAAMAAPIVPENNYYARLDAYHTSLEAGGVSITVTTVDGEVVEALPYTVDKVIPIKNMDGSVREYRNVTVPKAALDIISSFGAARLNGVFDFRDDAWKFSTDSSLEQFATEFLLWAVHQYMPAFYGQLKDGEYQGREVTTIEGKMTVTGIFAAAMNNVVDNVYDDFGTENKKIKDTANWDVVYDLIDSTLFKLLPTSWLPEINGSNQFFNDWLFGNLINFDLQGILGLLTVNDDPNAELNQSVTKVLLNIVDRVLALVFNDNAILNPSGRTDVVMNNNVTTKAEGGYTTLAQLVNCSSKESGIPRLIYNLLTFLDRYKEPLLGTLLPLIASSAYERPYDTEYLTYGDRNEVYYKVNDLENYIDNLFSNTNAYPVKVYYNIGDAEAAVDGRATAIKNADKVSTDVILSNGTTYGTYSSLAEAKKVIEQLRDAYFVEELVDEEAQTYKYTLYFKESYYTAATPTLKTDSDGNAYNEYSAFRYAQLQSRTNADPFVSYDDDYRFFAFEDFGNAGFAYNNSGDAEDSARAFVDSYNSFIENDLSNAYGAWFMYNIECQLKKNDLYDSNDDGRSVVATDGSDTDYVAETVDANGNVTDPGFPQDGDPSAPEKTMYPYFTTASNELSYFDIDDGKAARNAQAGKKSGWFDQQTGQIISGYNSDYFKPDNFEQLALAVEYGNDPERNVALSDADAEKIVRLVLGNLDFDITADGDGQYDGSKKWYNLNDTELTAIANWLAANSFTYEETTDAEGNVAYILKRPLFKFITDDSGMVYGNKDYSVEEAPVYDAIDRTVRSRKAINSKDTYEDEVILAQADGYYLYVETLYANRRSLYNTIDTLSWRLEEAEKVRSKGAHLEMINWLLALTEKDYRDVGGTNKRNYVFLKGEDGQPIIDENGNKTEVKAYTTASYEVFRDAWDFADDISEAASKGDILAAGVTQSMISEAYFGLLEAWQKLVAFTGFADWLQIDSFVAIAEEILADPYLDDPNFGVKSGLAELEAALADALVYTDYEGSAFDRHLNSKKNYDSESQTAIDAASAALNQAIQNLVYHKIPSILLDPESEAPVKIQDTKYESQIQYAHIYGLEEGVGFGDGTLTTEEVMDYLGLKVTGMAVDGDTTVVQRANSSRGSGTNARIDGKFQNFLRFRYFAVLYGDLNGDTRIDSTDAAALNLYLAKDENTSALMGEAKYEAADVDHNGSVDINDVAEIVRHYSLDIDEETDNVYKIDQDRHSPVPEYTATFVADGTTVEERSVIFGSCLTSLPVAPTKDGYTFTGWYNEAGELLTSSTKMPNNDVTYTAVYEANAAA